VCLFKQFLNPKNDGNAEIWGGKLFRNIQGKSAWMYLFGNVVSKFFDLHCDDVIRHNTATELILWSENCIIMVVCIIISTLKIYKFKKGSRDQ